jgi:hypothetical protein
MNKHELSRRQFLRTASMASMAGFSVSPFLLELNSVAARLSRAARRTIARWSVSFWLAVMMGMER